MTRKFRAMHFVRPSLMLHTRDGMTLPVGLAAPQGFFVLVQRYFVRGLAGAVKG